MHGVGRVNFMNLKKCAQNQDTEVLTASTTTIDHTLSPVGYWNKVAEM